MSERINLTGIEARCKAATPGPWTWDSGCLLHEELDLMVVAHDPQCAWKVDDDDRGFIAHARTDLPALVAWVKDARGALVVAREDAEREGWDARVSRYDALLSRLEENL